MGCFSSRIVKEIKCTDLRNTKKLTPQQVKSAKNWKKAKYDKDFRAKLGLPPETSEPNKSNPSPQTSPSK